MIVDMIGSFSNICVIYGIANHTFYITFFLTLALSILLCLIILFISV